MRPILALAACTMMAGPLSAALPQGARAPQISTVGAVGGKAFKLNLRDQLRRGTVVLYFFPAAFTKGCTLEAHAFSEKMPEFRNAGAQVIGMSADPLDKLRKFSVEECRSAFPVATATPATITAYDVAWKEKPGLTTRTSYVIARDGRIVMVHDELDWSQHVARTLAAVKALKR